MPPFRYMPFYLFTVPSKPFRAVVVGSTSFEIIVRPLLSDMKPSLPSLITVTSSHLDKKSSGVGEDEGPFRFDCDDLEVKLSPRSREREDSNTASSSALNALVTEVTIMLAR